MTTQQLYQKVLNEEMSQSDFLWRVRRDSNINASLSNIMSFDDTVLALKGKGFIWESVEGDTIKPLDFLGSFKALAEANKLKGGKGDKLTPDRVNYHEFTKGWKHELEHTDDIDVAKEIALDHLAEDPNYYTRLDMIEYQGKKEKKKEKPQEPKQGLKDKDNQMVSPKGIEKHKKNVGNKKEKATKVTGVKTMKGGSEAPKTIKEAAEDKTKKKLMADLEKLKKQYDLKKITQDKYDIKKKVIIDKYKKNISSIEKDYTPAKIINQPSDKKPIDKKPTDTKNVSPSANIKYDPKQIYMYKKIGQAPKAEKISLTAFNKLMDDSEVTDFSAFDVDGFEKLKAKKDNIIGRAKFDDIEPEAGPGKKRKPRQTGYQKYAAKDTAQNVKAKGGKVQKYKAVKGPLAPGEVDLPFDDARAYLHKYGLQSLELVSKDVNTAPSKFTAAKGKVSSYKVIKGPGAGSRYPVNLDAEQVKKWTSKYGDDSLEPTDNVNLRYSTTTPGKSTSAPLPADAPRYQNTPDISTAGTRQVVAQKSSAKSSPYYVINKDAETKQELDLKGFDTMTAARDAAKALNAETKVDSYRAIPAIILNKYINDLNEELEKADIKKVKDKEVNFIIPKGGDKDKEVNVLNRVSAVSMNKKSGHLTITFIGGTSLDVFRKRNSEELVSTYTDNAGKTTKVLDIGGDLTKLVKKAFAQVEPEVKEPETDQAVEAYIRKRIQQAIKESEVGQYIGFQGPAVKKKNLHDIMKRYEWGYPDSEDPYVRDKGSEDNKTVAQFVGELGQEGVDIFNQYAPTSEYEIKSVDDLGGYMKGARGGMPQDRAFNPDALDQRSGRVAEEATTPEEDKKMSDLAKHAMGNALDAHAEEVASKLLNYISRKGDANIKDKNIITAAHKMADKVKK